MPKALSINMKCCFCSKPMEYPNHVVECDGELIDCCEKCMKKVKAFSKKGVTYAKPGVTEQD